MATRSRSLPAGFTGVASSRDCPYAAMHDPQRKFYGVQFHPEVVHTPQGGDMLWNFAMQICHCKPDWEMTSFIDQAIEPTAQRSAKATYCSASAVASTHPSLPPCCTRPSDQLHCVFVDNGLLRHAEVHDVETLFGDAFGIDLHVASPATDLPGTTQGRRRSGRKAQNHRQNLHRCLCRKGTHPRARGFPGPRHTLSGCDRIHLTNRRPLRHDQIPS
jgi:hypothetical protein